jgi:hypothetical protein
MTDTSQPGFYRWNGTAYVLDLMSSSEPSGTATGDLTGYYPSPTVDHLTGADGYLLVEGILIGDPINGGIIFIGSGQAVQQITVVSSTYSVDTNSSTSDYIIFTDSTNNAITITLPTPAAGRTLIIKDKTGKAATHNVTISHHASETIDGSNTYVIYVNYTSITICSDGSNWSII